MATMFMPASAPLPFSSFTPPPSPRACPSRLLLFLLPHRRHNTSCSSSRQKGFLSSPFLSVRAAHSSSSSSSYSGSNKEDENEMIKSSNSTNKVEIVYDPRSKLDEINSEFSRSLRNLTLFSPAKINVFLRITSKRPDGYHDLASLFHVVSLGDIIKFSISPSTTKDSITTNVPGIPLDERNLIIKALNLYRKKTGSNVYYWIHLDKKVPTGAGLGGGSGNAATALWAANRLNGDLVAEKQLQTWSAEIGSDVPFFFSKGSAYCTGRGEIVEDVPSLPLDLPLVLIKPKEECSTVEVYKRFKLNQASCADPRKLLEDIISNGISQPVCINDLEFPAFEVLPSLKSLKERILTGSRGRYQAVFMSGSGSTIVSVGDSEPPQFIYDDEEYQDIFVSEATFVTRKQNEWYEQHTSNSILQNDAVERSTIRQGKV